MRLFGILKAAFNDHPRASLMIQAFSEGLPLDNSVVDTVRFMGNVTCGFELLRQLSQQFSLRSRAEALSMRSELLGRIFALKHSEMTSATVVGDVIRKIDIEVARFSKLLATLPSHMDRQGLSVGGGDMLVILLRSLPDEAKKYVLHHSTGDTYHVARMAALKFEQQQRLFLHLNLGGKRHVSEMFDLTATDHNEQYEQAWYDEQAWYEDYQSIPVSAVQNERCDRCGRKHKTANCNTDMSKVKCFACNEYGHISAHCKKSFQASGLPPGKGKSKDGEKGKGKGKGQEKGKPSKGKGKANKGGKGKKGSKGKKGKMYELMEIPQDHQEAADEEHWEETWWGGAGGDAWGEEDWAGYVPAQDGKAIETPSLQLSALFTPGFPDALGLRSEQRHEECSLFRDTCCDCDLLCIGQHVCGDMDFHVSFGMACCCFGMSNGSDMKFSETSNHVPRFPSPKVQDSMSRQLEVSPLLVNEVFENAHDAEWWLIDSGAGVTVLSERSARFFGVSEEVLSAAKVDQGFSAANGSPVKMLVEVLVHVNVLLEDATGKRTYESASMHVWVGETQHNILSTTMLCIRGWTFAQDRDGLTLQAPGGSIATEVTLFGNVPWLRLRPGKKEAGAVDSGSLSLTSVVVSPVTKSTEAELAQHRLQGHTPFHPGCRHCQIARSVHQHRKRDKGRLESEVVADFFFLTTTGEDLRSERLVNYLKVLVLVERMSSMIGAVVVSSNVVQTRSGIVAWLKEFGLTSGACSVRLVTDAEGAVADLVGTSSGAFSFQVKRAEPQNHEAVGSAERGVRRLKESLQTLRSDLNVEGLDVFHSRWVGLCPDLSVFQLEQVREGSRV